jgi:hypothetical protein
MTIKNTIRLIMFALFGFQAAIASAHEAQSPTQHQHYHCHQNANCHSHGHDMAHH